MPRKQNCFCKKIKFKPGVVYFKPQGVPIRKLEIVELLMEEIEAYRLRYVGNLEQTKAAAEMRTSQSTYQRILHSAHQKIADALINGKAIKIIEHD